MAKKPKPAQYVVQNCTFHGAQQSSEADIKRYEAVKAIADALHEAAKSIAGPQNNVGLLIKGDSST